MKAFAEALTYPSICLLIAAVHTRTSGHEAFTFEMLHEVFREQVRISLSAPVTVEGGGIGMVRCSREVLFGVCVIYYFICPRDSSSGTL